MEEPMIVSLKRDLSHITLYIETGTGLNLAGPVGSDQVDRVSKDFCSYPYVDDDTDALRPSSQQSPD